MHRKRGKTPNLLMRTITKKKYLSALLTLAENVHWQLMPLDPLFMSPFTHKAVCGL